MTDHTHDIDDMPIDARHRGAASPEDLEILDPGGQVDTMPGMLPTEASESVPDRRRARRRGQP